MPELRNKRAMFVYLSPLRNGSVGNFHFEPIGLKTLYFPLHLSLPAGDYWRPAAHRSEEPEIRTTEDKPLVLMAEIRICYVARSNVQSNGRIGDFRQLRHNACFRTEMFSYA